jgi:hypothetical protein
MEEQLLRRWLRTETGKPFAGRLVQFVRGHTSFQNAPYLSAGACQGIHVPRSSAP